MAIIHNFSCNNVSNNSPKFHVHILNFLGMSACLFFTFKSTTLIERKEEEKLCLLTKYLQLMPDLPGLASETYVHLTDVMASVLDYEK